MRQLSDLPDGKTKKVRSVELEPHVDALVFQHMNDRGLGSFGAALRDLIDRGLAVEGLTGGANTATDQRARAYREAMKKVERELTEVARDALNAHAQRLGVGPPKVAARGADDARRVERAAPRTR